MRIAVISARYGEDIVGGAETLARGLLEELAGRGYYAEVWTTCARSHQTWDNSYDSGEVAIKGVHVRRFEIDPWDPQPQHTLNAKLINHGYLSAEEQYGWIESGPSSSAMYEHAIKHAAEFDAVIVIPVVNTLTYQAAFLVRDRLVVWPCLHDEVFAYMEPFRLLIESAYGSIFNSPEEYELANKGLEMKLQRSAVIGSGVKVQASDITAAPEQTPYLLYIGRMEEGKNLPLLVEYVTRYVAEGHSLKLISAGSGTYATPKSAAFEHRGFVDESEKALLYSNALALCQPSTHESFSLTMMESWLAGRPSLVHANCAVTRGHAARARGGLWFKTYGEFRGALDWFQENPELAQRMGRNGREYVKINYMWPIVTERFLTVLHQWGIVNRDR